MSLSIYLNELDSHLLTKENWNNNTISLNFTNLLNERYEKPATYSQDGRAVSFGFRRAY